MEAKDVRLLKEQLRDLIDDGITVVVFEDGRELNLEDLYEVAQDWHAYLLFMSQTKLHRIFEMEKNASD